MIPANHSRTVIHGAMPGGDVWQVGFWASEAPTSADAATSQASDLLDDLADVWADDGSPRGSFSVDTTVAGVTVYSYRDDSGIATYVGEAPATMVGVGQQNMPNQVAVCHTLLTPLSGRRRTGRVYFPVTIANFGNGEFTQAQVDGKASWLADLLTTWNGHLPSAANFVVLSQVGGFSTEISAVRVDTRPDIQRRRANQQMIVGRAQSPVTHP